MEKAVQNIPFLRITIAFAFGIIIASNIAIDPTIVLIFLFATLFFLILVNAFFRYSLTLVFGWCTLLFFIFCGMFISQRYNKNPVLCEQGYFAAVLLEKPQEKANSYKSTLQIETAFHSNQVQAANETVIAYFAKNDSIHALQAGDIILFDKTPQIIENKNNPHEFDYKNYLKKKRIYRQVYLPSGNWEKSGKSKKNIFILAEQLRENLLQIYRNQPIDSTEFEILSALTLGYKRELDPETKRIFSASGASHVLAVSGLHVGIVFWVISLVFGFLRKGKTGRILFMLFSISILWIYALITGLSPSVMRASTMFTIFVVGENIKRKSNIYNSMAASAFLLLLINPNNLYDIGFQLSYAALFGIVYLQPKFEKLIVVQNKVLKFFLTLITVSVAAQIATFPITSFYFHQFPSYFWITNTFIIPAVMVLIPLGMLLLAVSTVPVFSTVLAFAVNTIIKLIYFLLSFLYQLPFALIDVSTGSLQLGFLLASIGAAFIYIHKYNIFYLKATLLFFLFLMLTGLLNSIIQKNHTELIVYNNAKNTAVHLIKGKDNYVITEEKISVDELNFHPAIATIRKLGLNPPRYLLSSDSVAYKNLFLKNKLVIFEGKSLSINKKINELNKNKLPDFIIVPHTKDFESFDLKTVGTIITSHSSKNDFSGNPGLIHNTTLNGAFQKKW